MNDDFQSPRRGASVTTMVAEFQELPTAKRHLYFYILLILLALLGDTIKRSGMAPRSEANTTRTP